MSRMAFLRKDGEYFIESANYYFVVVFFHKLFVIH